MAEGEIYTPEALEMVELAMRECFALISEGSTPAHVKSKAIDSVPKLVAARNTIIAPDGGNRQVDSIWDRLDGLPPERQKLLLKNEIERLSAELIQMRQRFDALDVLAETVGAGP